MFDRHPELTAHMAHLSGGIAGMLARIRSFQDKDFWGTAGNPRHGAKRQEENFDYYIRHNMVFDTAGFAGGIGAVKAGLSEIPAARMVFATDYPQEIREREAVRNFVRNMLRAGRRRRADYSPAMSGCCSGAAGGSEDGRRRADAVIASSVRPRGAKRGVEKASSPASSDRIKAFRLDD